MQSLPVQNGETLQKVLTITFSIFESELSGWIRFRQFEQV